VIAPAFCEIDSRHASSSWTVGGSIAKEILYHQLLAFESDPAVLSVEVDAADVSAAE
jgi:hypothetical protein